MNQNEKKQKEVHRVKNTAGLRQQATRLKAGNEVLKFFILACGVIFIFNINLVKFKNV